MVFLTNKPKHLLIIFISGLIIYIIALILGSILYPSGFSILTGFISDLGAPSLTPFYWISIIGHVSFSLGSILVLLRVYKQIKSRQNKDLTKAFWGLLLNLLGCFGLMGVGIINEDFGDIHGVFAMMIFVGFIFGSFLFGKGVTEGSSFGKPMNTKNFERLGKKVCIVLICLQVIGAILLKFPGQITYTLVEWLSLFVFLIWLTVIALESTQSPLLEKKD